MKVNPRSRLCHIMMCMLLTNSGAWSVPLSLKRSGNSEGEESMTEPETPAESSLCTFTNLHKLAVANHFIDEESTLWRPLEPTDKLNLRDKREAPGSSRMMDSWRMKKSAVSIQHYRGMEECGNSTSDVTAALTHRSLCPWKWEANVDEMRVPRRLLQARCSCPDRPPVLGFECETMYTKVKAARFAPGSCTELLLYEETVPLGCITVMPATGDLKSLPPTVDVIDRPTMET